MELKHNEFEHTAIQQLKDFIKQCITIDDAELDSIVGFFKHQKVNRKEVLLRQGDVCKDFYFIVKGALRVFYLSENGSEKTSHISLEDTIISSMSSFISQTPSFEIIDALEDTDLLVINRTDFYNLVDSNKYWDRLYRYILEIAYITKVKRIEIRTTLQSKERFELVMNETPGLINRVSNKVLSSYLDMSQETLSRLKSVR